MQQTNSQWHKWYKCGASLIMKIVALNLPLFINHTHLIKVHPKVFFSSQDLCLLFHLRSIYINNLEALYIYMYIYIYIYPVLYKGQFFFHSSLKAVSVRPTVAVADYNY